MKVLIIWVCATATMDDCQVKTMSLPLPAAQCEQRKAVSTQVLGTGPEQNYRLECEDA